MAVEAHATARYVRTSAQKAGLVMDLIRGRDVNRALATLQFTRKGIGHDIAKLLRSAIANAQQKDGFGGDVDRLYVSACYANQGPSMKRIRPAPMGRACRAGRRDREAEGSGAQAGGSGEEDRRAREEVMGRPVVREWRRLTGRAGLQPCQE